MRGGPGVPANPCAAARPSAAGAPVARRAPFLRAPSLRCRLLRPKSSPGPGLFLPTPPLSCCQLRQAVRNFTWTLVLPCAARSRLTSLSPSNLLPLGSWFDPTPLTTCSFLGIEVFGLSQITPSAQSHHSSTFLPSLTSLPCSFNFQKVRYHPLAQSRDEGN